MVLLVKQDLLALRAQGDKLDLLDQLVVQGLMANQDHQDLLDQGENVESRVTQDHLVAKDPLDQVEREERQDHLALVVTEENQVQLELLELLVKLVRYHNHIKLLHAFQR